MTELLALPNVYWLGFKPYEQIPAYGSAFDIALMPWLDNEWIRHSNPIKLKEYLALGLPIISTNFPEAQHYADVINIARDSEDFVEQIRLALAGKSIGSKESRRRRVANASWDSQANRLLTIGERTQN